jgi:hypothetical protein
MKKIILSLLCFIQLLLFSNCTPGKYTVSANGDEADVKLKNGKSFSAEIVSISDSAVFFASIPTNIEARPVIFYSLNQDIKLIEVQGYDGSGWLTPVLLFQVLPAGLLAGAAASVGNNAVSIGLVSAIPAVITSILLSSSNGKTPQWNDRQPLEELESLNIYSRYPKALSEDELNRLLKRYNQKAVKNIFK